ncbi:hypothetical protein LTR36_005944 [Oleoguttula mirabilis]|uniref:Apple domain-containing protein n=1 Tax=Oleoguttula mirabilis TaxID=1507867 RepID=A0AAV9JCS5_9PEZI|nr:hypothetical protein LTR36_005944 [Oleoguttula mirabilis]
MHSFASPVWQSLAVLALAALPANAQSTVTQSSCTTAMSSKSISPVKTSSNKITITNTPTTTVTSTPSTVKTPHPSTVTTTVASITTLTVTNSQITDVFTDTITVLTTSTSTAPTSTYTSTVTQSTDTSVTSTSTVGTPSGFIPIQTSVPEAPARKRDAQPLSPNSGSLIARANVLKTLQGGGSGTNAKTQYPQKVSCLIEVTVYKPAKTVVQMARTTKTLTTTASTSTITSTTTISATSTVLLSDASTTVSTTSIIIILASTTPSTTVYTTTTTTNTVVAATATYYAQCQSDNFIGTNGYTGAGSAEAYVVNNINSAYDCCAACASTTGCEFVAYDADVWGCMIFYNDAQTCTDTAEFALDQSVNRYTASNGCLNAT